MAKGFDNAMKNCATDVEQVPNDSRTARFAARGENFSVTVLIIENEETLRRAVAKHYVRMAF
jgi:hypothetical protein